MKQRLLATAAAALVLGSTGAFANAEWRADAMDPRVERVEVTRVDIDPMVREDVAAAPVVVERESIVSEPVIVARDEYPAAYDGRFHDDPLFEVVPRPHPEALFTREGPNDFGA